MLVLTWRQTALAHPRRLLYSAPHNFGTGGKVVPTAFFAAPANPHQAEAETHAAYDDHHVASNDLVPHGRVVLQGMCHGACIHIP
jgi:hypothetical protein